MEAEMRGILSAVPGPSAIRLMVGTHLLLLIQAALVLWSAPHVDMPLRILVGMVFAIAAGGLVAAIHGGGDERRQDWWRRRHGR
jgi:peptidoglycan/LPS O-acetylase OafA/YrhL